eukprot:320977-Chlamydomonas_euryale.AAC.2
MGQAVREDQGKAGVFGAWGKGFRIQVARAWSLWSAGEAASDLSSSEDAGRWCIAALHAQASPVPHVAQAGSSCLEAAARRALARLVAVVGDGPKAAAAAAARRVSVAGAQTMEQVAEPSAHCLQALRERRRHRAARRARRRVLRRVQVARRARRGARVAGADEGVGAAVERGVRYHGERQAHAAGGVGH